MKRLPVLVPATVIVCLFGFCAGRAGAETTWYVDDDAPADFSTIQAAIGSASDGDTIVVRDGYYTGDGNRDIDFLGKAVHLMSENGPEGCIIDAGAEWGHRVFVFQNGEGEDSLLDGFIITRGYIYTGSGGAGIWCQNSSPTVMNNVITGNWTYIGDGGGIYCSNSSPSIANNVITGNSVYVGRGGGIYSSGGSPSITGNTITGNTTYWGAGIYCSNGSPSIAKNVITGNRASPWEGGAIYSSGGSPSITGNTIAENTAGSSGGGIYRSGGPCTITNNTIVGNSASIGAGITCSTSSATATIKNCILWANGDDLHGCAATYSCIQDGDAGTGNIDEDPLFADASNGDYHLKSMVGRWDPAANGGAGAWVYDAVSSPCIDAGEPASDFTEEPQLNGGRINMGAHGNTDEASKSGYLLVVRSTPINGVSIAGDKPGVTDYWVACEELEVVNLTAPASTTTGEGITYNFVRWEGLADGVATIQVTVDSSHTVVAVYEVQTWTLSVESSPISGVAITGDKPGTTGYAANCEDQEIVNLTAPLTVTDATVRYDFVRWIVDGTDQPIGQTDVQITVDADIAATAVYAVRTHTLTVLSMPVSGVVVTGNRPGTTPYAATCDDQQFVTLTAPVALPGGSSRENHFLYWAVDNEPQPYGERELQLIMDSDHTAVAVYDWRLPGDVTGDCMVNVLDMIFVRKPPRTACSE